MHTEFNVETWQLYGTAVVVPNGSLDTGSYGTLRGAVMEVASDEPRAVIVDLDRLWIDGTSTLKVFGTVSSELAIWPGLPLLLVTTDVSLRQAFTSTPMRHGIPVHGSVEAAVDAVGEPPPRRIARLALPNSWANVELARDFVRECCERWGVDADRATDAMWIANEFVRSTMKYTCGPPTIRVESRRDLLTVAVYDENPGLFEQASTGSPEGDTRGLSVVVHICHACGLSRTTSGGKVVWAAVRRR
ncbi:hypothetical protein [Actinophytocola sp.]|uniref:hypothetical protein n=1 Tax=Actinophytocola sp. TaxID=1872138 RepID=UPI003D6B242C